MTMMRPIGHQKQTIQCLELESTLTIIPRNLVVSRFGEAPIANIGKSDCSVQLLDFFKNNSGKTAGLWNPHTQFPVSYLGNGRV